MRKIISTLVAVYLALGIAGGTASAVAQDSGDCSVATAAISIESSFSTYQYIVDFGNTYPDIAEDFVPPFKVCQTYSFTLTLTNIPPAGSENYDEVLLWVQLTDSRTATSEAEITIQGVSGTVSANLSRKVLNSTDYLQFDLIAPLEASATHTYNATLHLKDVGLYVLCFVAYCPTEAEVVAEKCITTESYQWVDAYAIDLYRNWSLISLPLAPFDTDVEAILAAYSGRDEILSVWYYDAATMLWPSYGPGAPSDLPTMEDGRAYWLRIYYNGLNPPGAYHGTLWVFGSAAPLPPAPALAYPVVAGWNMVGFTSTTSMSLEQYLWNFYDDLGPQFVTYGWEATTQNWSLIGEDEDLALGHGYWIAFEAGGTIYPPH